MTVPSGAERRLAALALAAALLAPQGLRAADRLVLEPHLDVGQTFTDNVFYDGSDEKSDTITRITPSLHLSSRSENGSGKVKFGAQIREYWRYSELNAVDPFVAFDARRNLTPLWSASGEGRYRLRHSTDAVSDGDTDVYGARPDIETLNLGGSLTRRLSPSMTLSAQAFYLDVHYDEGSEVQLSDPNAGTGHEFENYTDYGIRMLGMSWQRTLSPVESIGLVADYQRIPLDASVSLGDVVRRSREDHIYRLAARWTRSWTPRLLISLEAGARYLDTTGGSVVGLEEQKSNGSYASLNTTPDASLGFVGEANLDYRTLHGRLNLHLSRETRPDNGSKGSRNVDRLAMTFDRALGRRLRLNTYATYTQSSSSSTVVQPFRVADASVCKRPGSIDGAPACLVDVDSALNEEYWNAGFELSWRIRRLWWAYAGYRFTAYSDDLPANEFGDRGWNANRVMVGFRWSHDVPL